MALGKPGITGVTAGNAAAMPMEVDILPNPIILVGQFEGLAASVRSFREPLTKSIKEVAIPSITKNFAVEGRPEWPQLQRETVHVREQLGFSGEHPILIRTGRLFKTATAFARWSIGKDQAYVSNWPQYAWYGPIHQTGAATGSDAFSLGIPQRIFMSLQDEDVLKIQEVFFAWVQKKALEHGFV